MAIAVLCPGCKVRLTVGDDRAGDILDCPNCDLRIRIPAMLPASSSATSQAAGQSTTQAPPKPAPPKLRPRPVPQAAAPAAPQITALTVWLDDPDDDRPRRRRRPRFRCPYCGSRERPYWRQQISSGGWVVFAVLLVLFWPLCFLGLFIKEDVRSCYECGIRV